MRRVMRRISWGAPAAVGGGSAAAVAARLTRSAVFPVPTVTVTAVPFDVETEDTHGFHDSGASTRLTVPTDQGGIYLVGGSITWSSAVQTGVRNAYIRKNGVDHLSWRSLAGTSSAGGVTITDVPPALVRLVATDYVELLGYQDTAGNLDILRLDSGGRSPYFWLCRLGDAP